MLDDAQNASPISATQAMPKTRRFVQEKKKKNHSEKPQKRELAGFTHSPQSVKAKNIDNPSNELGQTMETYFSNWQGK